MLEFRELRGLAQVTVSKKHRSWSYSNVTSRPRKILATKLPPGRRTCSVMLRACGNWSSAGVHQKQPAAGHETYCQQELRLDKLVEVVQTGHVGRAVADDEVRSPPLEVRDDLFRRTRLGDVALDLDHARYRCLRADVRGSASGESTTARKREHRLTMGCKSTATTLALPSTAGSSALQ